MSDRILRSVLATALLFGLFFAGAARSAAQDFRNNFYVHQFWVELEATPGGANAFSGPNVQSPAGPASGGPAAGASRQSKSPSAPSSVSPGAGGASAPGTGAAAPGGSGKGRSPQEAAVGDILKEAQWVYSGMIYGFSFTYIPADTARGIKGSFVLTPVAQIKWGDPHLKVLNTRREGSRFIARVLYTLEPFQERWTRGWDSNVYPSSTGRGSSRYFLSYRQKMVSYRDAIKEAIRNYLTQRIYNRPRKVTGQVVLRGNPYTVIDSGRYVTTLTVKLRIDKVEPYTVY